MHNVHVEVTLILGLVATHPTVTCCVDSQVRHVAVLSLAKAASNPAFKSFTHQPTSCQVPKSCPSTRAEFWNANLFTESTHMAFQPPPRLPSDVGLYAINQCT